MKTIRSFIIMLTTSTILAIAGGCRTVTPAGDVKIHSETQDEQELLVMENQFVRIALTPARGAHITEFTLKSTGHNVLDNGNECWEGYTDILDKEWPGPDIQTKPYSVSTQQSDSRGTITCSYVCGEVLLERMMSLDADSSVLEIVIRLTNRGREAQTLCYGAHVCLATGDSDNAPDLILWPQDQDIKRGSVDYSCYAIQSFETPPAWIAFLDTQKGGLIITDFSRKAMDHFLIYTAQGPSPQAYWQWTKVPPGGSREARGRLGIAQGITELRVVGESTAADIKADRLLYGNDDEVGIEYTLCGWRGRAPGPVTVRICSLPGRRVVWSSRQNLGTMPIGGSCRGTCQWRTGGAGNGGYVLELEADGLRASTTFQIDGKIMNPIIKTIAECREQLRGEMDKGMRDRVELLLRDAQASFSLQTALYAAGFTASGVVFSDLNQNGRQDSGEDGVAQVAVSDGVRIMHTDTQGHYQLTNISTIKSRFVFITTPAGYTAWNRFYAAIPSVPSNMVANFALWPMPATSSNVFKFAHIADIHISTTNDAKIFVDDLREIEIFGPDFIMATGDLVSDGSKPVEFVNYQSALQQTKLPVINVVGNHDGASSFEKFLGPTYYAFDYGPKHFIIFNCLMPSKAQWAWLRQDLADQRSSGKDVLVFLHFTPSAKLITLLQQFNAQAVFSGHWHSSRVVPCGNILSVNTPPPRFAGIDTSPRGFRLITCQAGKLFLDDHYSGCKQLCALVAPAEAANILTGAIPIQAAAYDSSWPVMGVEYQWNNGGWNNMTPQNKFCWQAQENCPSPGTNQVKIKVHLGETNVLERQSTFAVSARALPVPEAGRDWPMFHNDAGRTGATDENVIPPLHLAWFKTLGGTIHFSSPVVTEGMVYIGVADEENKGQAGIYALDGVTGAVKWHYVTAASIRHTVAVDRQRCYGVTIDGMVIALDKATGTLVWQYGLGNEMERWSSRWSIASPLVCDNVVYAGVAPYFVALEATTGKKIWRASSMGPDWMNCLSSPACDKERIFVGFNWNARGLFALDRINGLPIWNNTNYGGGCASPVYSDGKLYYYGGHALDPQSGACLWKNCNTVSTPAIAGNTLVIGCPDNKIKAIDSVTGKEIWTYLLKGRVQFAFSPYCRTSAAVISSPAIAGQVVYCGGTSGQFVALDLQSGKLLWSYDLGIPITSSPAVSGNTVYIATFDGTVYAFTALGRSP